MSQKYFSLISIAIISISVLLANSAFAVENKSSLIGEINTTTGLYTSGDKIFRVTLPVKGPRADVLNAITEIYSLLGTVILIKAKESKGTYRLEITPTLDTNKRQIPFSQASAKTFDWYRRLAVRTYQSPLLELSTYAFTINGKQSMAAIYKQFSSSTQGPRFHLFYLTDFGNSLAFVWTDIPLAAENIAAEEKIIDGSAEQAIKSITMLRSLTFN